MKNALLLVIIWVGIITFASGYLAMEENPAHQTFEFFSGGAYHVEGYGEWAVRVDIDGVFSTTHSVQGEVTDYGPFVLAKHENRELWRLIRAVPLKDMESSDRSGVPDEVRYSLLLREDGQVHSVSLWVGDAREDERIVALVAQLAALIEELTGEKPVLY